MSSNEHERAFLDKTRSVLDQGAQDLDTGTLVRLREMRERALEGPSSRANWLIPAGGLAVAASVAILTVAVWTAGPGESGLMPSLDDMELLSDSGSLDFFEELEFYAWLEKEEGSG